MALFCCALLVLIFENHRETEIRRKTETMNRFRTSLKEGTHSYPPDSGSGDSPWKLVPQTQSKDPEWQQASCDGSVCHCGRGYFP